MYDYLRSLVSSSDKSEEVSTPPAGVEQPHGNQAAMEAAQNAMDRVKPRIVEGGGGYLYRQHCNGVVEILEGDGQGLKLSEGDRGWDAITAQIGKHPAQDSSPPTSTGPQDAEPVLFAAEEEHSTGWGLPTMGLPDLQLPEVSLPEWGLPEMLGHDALPGFGELAETMGELLPTLGLRDPEAESQEAVARAIAHSQQAAAIASSQAAAHAGGHELPGYDESAVQTEMRELFDSYRGIELSVPILGESTKVTVRAKYKWNKAGDDWLGLGSERWNYKAQLQGGKGSDGIEHTYGFARGYGGKASPEELAEGLQESIDRGELRGLLNDATSTAEAQTIIQGYAHRRLGVDCSGFAWQMMNTVSDFDTFTPVYRKDEKWTGPEFVADTEAEKTGWSSSRAIHESGLDLTDRPAAWSAMDLLTGEGHIVVIYDSDEIEAGIHEVHVMESTGSNGVGEAKYWFVEGTGFCEKGSTTDRVFWLKGWYRVTRPVLNEKAKEKIEVGSAT